MLSRINILNLPKCLILVVIFIFSTSSSNASIVNLANISGNSNGLIDNSFILQNALTSYDTVYIPSGYTCIISKTIKLKSNNYLIGKDSKTSVVVLNADKFTWSNIFNPAAFVNINGGYNDVKEFYGSLNYGIGISQLTFRLEGEVLPNMQSILRFSGVDGLKIEKCIFKVLSATSKGHNAIIDLHARYQNVTIKKCIFIIKTSNILHGGGIWVQNTSNSTCSDIIIEGCTFNADSKDEMIGVYTTNNGYIKNVLIQNNSFADTKYKATNISLVTIFNNVSDVIVLGNKFNIMSNHKKIDGIIRVGISSDINNLHKPHRVKINDNTFAGKLSNSYCIRSYSGTEGTINNNIFLQNGKVRNMPFMKFSKHVGFTVPPN